MTPDIWAEVLNEAMPQDHAMSMVQIYERVTRGKSKSAHTFLKPIDLTQALIWAKDEEGGMTYDRRTYQDIVMWTRTKELKPPPKPKRDPSLKTVVKSNFPTSSIAEPRQNKITIKSPPWEEAT